MLTQSTLTLTNNKRKFESISSTDKTVNIFESENEWRTIEIKHNNYSLYANEYLMLKCKTFRLFRKDNKDAKIFPVTFNEFTKDIITAFLNILEDGNNITCKNFQTVLKFSNYMECDIVTKLLDTFITNVKVTITNFQLLFESKKRHVDLFNFTKYPYIITSNNCPFINQIENSEVPESGIISYMLPKWCTLPTDDKISRALSAYKKKNGILKALDMQTTTFNYTSVGYRLISSLIRYYPFEASFCRTVDKICACYTENDDDDITDNE